MEVDGGVGYRLAHQWKRGKPLGETRVLYCALDLKKLFENVNCNQMQVVLWSFVKLKFVDLCYFARMSQRIKCDEMYNAFYNYMVLRNNLGKKGNHLNCRSPSLWDPTHKCTIRFLDAISRMSSFSGLHKPVAQADIRHTTAERGRTLSRFPLATASE